MTQRLQTGRRRTFLQIMITTFLPERESGHAVIQAAVNVYLWFLVAVGVIELSAVDHTY